MNLAETEKLLICIHRAYPNFFKDFDADTFEFQKKLWCNAFYDHAFSECFTAFEVWYNTEEFPPVPVQLKRILEKITKPSGSVISAEIAWETVDKAVRKFGSYGQDKAFATFTDSIKRAVRAVGGWQKICSTELGREWDFLRKNFMECYKEFGQDDKQQELLPSVILQRIMQMSQSSLLEKQANEPDKLELPVKE